MAESYYFFKRLTLTVSFLVFVSLTKTCLAGAIQHASEYENQTMTLTCRSVQDVEIERGIYLDRDNRCSVSDVTAQLQKICNQTSVCNVLVDDQLVGRNPCPGSQKLMKVDYKCKCKGPHYGATCNRVCSRQCKGDWECDATTGNCFHGCLPGYIEPKCRTGVDKSSYAKGTGKIYLTCNPNEAVLLIAASHFIPGTTCRGGRPTAIVQSLCSKMIPKHLCRFYVNNAVLGDPCPNGQGDLAVVYTCVCNKNNRYGPRCAHPCSRHCAGPWTCNQTNGHCKNGCAPGYTGDRCDTAVAQSGSFKEQSSMNIVCKKHEVVVIGSAFYYPRSPSSTCVGRNVTTEVRNLCSQTSHGQCQFLVLNQVLKMSDPCWRQPKKLDVAYKCECPKFHYGSECATRCSQNCAGVGTCDSVTGECNHGCDLGFHGSKCDLVCGVGCINMCSVACAGDGSCDRSSGVCTHGCETGYRGITCDAYCDRFTYGENCENTCSDHCYLDKTCDRVNGSCTFGCELSYRGDKCNISRAPVLTVDYNFYPHGALVGHNLTAQCTACVDSIGNITWALLDVDNSSLPGHFLDYLIQDRSTGHVDQVPSCGRKLSSSLVLMVTVLLEGKRLECTANQLVDGTNLSISDVSYFITIDHLGRPPQNFLKNACPVFFLFLLLLILLFIARVWLKRKMDKQRTKVKGDPKSHPYAGPGSQMVRPKSAAKSAKRKEKTKKEKKDRKKPRKTLKSNDRRKIKEEAAQKAMNLLTKYNSNIVLKLGLLKNPSTIGLPGRLISTGIDKGKGVEMGQGLFNMRRSMASIVGSDKRYSDGRSVPPSMRLRSSVGTRATDLSRTTDHSAKSPHSILSKKTTSVIFEMGPRAIKKTVSAFSMASEAGTDNRRKSSGGTTTGTRNP